MFYRDPYMLDFLGLRDTYSEKDVYKRQTMELVKKELGIQSKKINNAWYWILDSKYF